MAHILKTIIRSEKEYAMFYKTCENLQTIEKKIYVGIDYEFTKRNIEIMQVFLQNHTYILLKPNKFLIGHFYLHSKFNFILHGSDSLDLHYIYSEFKKYNKLHYFNTFLSNCYDTRFLCEYTKYKTNYIDYKCSLYTALLYTHTITEHEYSKLQQIEHKLHPIYKINWKILTPEILDYITYDVFYLENLLNNLENKLDKMEFDLINEMYRLSFLLHICPEFDYNIAKLKYINNEHIITNKIFSDLYKIQTFKKIFKLFNSNIDIQNFNKYKLYHLFNFFKN